MKLRFIEKLIIIVMLVLNVVYFIFTGSIDIKLLLVSMSGITSVVLSAKGHVYAYYLGVIYTLIYTYIAFAAKFYGSFAINVVYYLPMQFVGVYSWSKHASDEEGIIKVRELSNKQRGILGIILVLSIFIVGIVLKYLGDISPFIDAFTTTITVVAMYLCVKRFREHWFLWLFVNGANIALWIIAYLNKIDDSIFMIFMWVLFFTNAMYGFINWNRINREK